MVLSDGECLGTANSNIEYIDNEVLYDEATDTTVDAKGLNREKVNSSAPCTFEWRRLISIRLPSVNEVLREINLIRFVDKVDKI